jgi:membrane protein required for colicin V production
MNYIDIIILIFIVLAVIKGFAKGFIISLTSLAGLVLGILFSIKYAGVLAVNLESVFGNHSKFIYIAAYILCFALIVFIVHIIGKSIEKVMEIAALGFVNRIGGSLLGIVKVLFVFSAIFYLLKIIDPKSQIIKPETKQKSFFYQPLEFMLPSTLPFLKTQIEKVNDAIDGESEVE